LPATHCQQQKEKKYVVSAFHPNKYKNNYIQIRYFCQIVLRLLGGLKITSDLSWDYLRCIFNYIRGNFISLPMKIFFSGQGDKISWASNSQKKGKK
jgi:hypothetical protein